MGKSYLDPRIPAAGSSSNVYLNCFRIFVGTVPTSGYTDCDNGGKAVFAQLKRMIRPATVPTSQLVLPLHVASKQMSVWGSCWMLLSSLQRLPVSDWVNVFFTHPPPVHLLALFLSEQVASVVGVQLPEPEVTLKS